MDPDQYHQKPLINPLFLLAYFRMMFFVMCSGFFIICKNDSILIAIVCCAIVLGFMGLWTRMISTGILCIALWQLNTQSNFSIFLLTIIYGSILILSLNTDAVYSFSGVLKAFRRSDRLTVSLPIIHGRSTFSLITFTFGLILIQIAFLMLRPQTFQMLSLNGFALCVYSIVFFIYILFTAKLIRTNAYTKQLNLYFDADCTFCRRLAAALKTIDPLDRIHLCPVHFIEREKRELRAEYEGKVFEGSQVLPTIAKLVPLLRLSIPVLKILKTNDRGWRVLNKVYKPNYNLAETQNDYTEPTHRKQRQWQSCFAFTALLLITIVYFLNRI